MATWPKLVRRGRRRAPITDVARIALFAVVGWVALVWLAGAVYVLVSYAAASGHVEPRPLRRTLGAMARELWLVMWTQPLLPVFQFLLGVRLGSGGGDVPVVLVHGYFQNRVDFLYLAHRLRGVGAGPLFACNFFWPQRLERSSESVARFVERVLERTGAQRVDILTHSTGGLFALDLIEERPQELRRVAMIALPGKGVPWRGPVIGTAGSQLRAGSFYRSGRSVRVDTVPVLSVYSAHDNVVHPTSTSVLEGPLAENYQVEDPGHLSVLFDRQVADRVCAFLAAEQPEDRARPRPATIEGEHAD